MTDFKKGDLVLIVDANEFNGMICKYESTFDNGNLRLINQRDHDSKYFNYEKGKGVTFHPKRCLKIPLNNALNKKLYPDRIEYQGFLVTEKIRDTLIEENINIRRDNGNY